MKSAVAYLIATCILILGGWGVFAFYPYLFAKTIEGEILKVERVSQDNLIITPVTGVSPNSRGTQNPIFSFAVAIKDPQGEIHTASTEDRQWAVAQSGQCVEAKFLKYPPWNLDRQGTYYGARLIRLLDCKKP